jgi:alkanesulfonate monooxygenase SsuD/methylene tetrahydromethanopterin reductase-like flavin-dependent oxidoreductase (luciferase family)
MATATLQTLSNGRVIFGLATGDLLALKHKLGIDTNNIHQKLREALMSIRSLLAGKVTATSQFFLGKTTLQVSHHRTRILVGASGEKTLRMAADLADGVILNVFVSPELASESLGKIAESIRSNPNFVKACAMLLRPTDDVQSLARKMRINIATALTWPEGRLVAESASLPEERLHKIRRAMRRGRVDEATSLVPVEMVKSTIIMGSPGMCRERVAEYRAAGVDLPIVYAPSDQLESVLDIFG